MADPILITKQLSKKYRTQNNHFAIKDLNLSIGKGMLYGVIGPDGSGKSTTLRIMATVLKPSGGMVEVNGFNVFHNPERVRPQIGYMPQIFSLYPDLTVKENLDFFANINKVPKAEKEKGMQKMLSFTNLNDFQNRRAKDLSGGMKKKLALACALIHKPSILILDEPSTGLDPISRRELWQMVSEVVDGGVTAIISTPYMDEAERCNEVAILFEGTVITQGRPIDLKTDLPFEIVDLKARPRKIMRNIISNQEHLIDWRPVGDRIRITVEKGKSEKVINELKKDLSMNKAEIYILRKTKPLIEDVFTYKVNTLRGQYA